jgi:hypothetical protein
MEFWIDSDFDQPNWMELTVCSFKIQTLFYCLRIPTHYSTTALSNSAQNQSHIATDGLWISKSWYRAPSGAHDQIFITLWQIRSCFCVAPSLTRWWVCLLYVLLVLASVVFLGSESIWTRDHIFTVSDLTLPFSSPPTTRRVTVEPTSPRLMPSLCNLLARTV